MIEEIRQIAHELRFIAPQRVFFSMDDHAAWQAMLDKARKLADELDALTKDTQRSER